MLNYEDLVLQRNTRSDDTTEQKCNCNICLTARSHAKCKRMIGDKVEKNTGLYGSSELVDQLPNKTPPKKEEIFFNNLFYMQTRNRFWYQSSL